MELTMTKLYSGKDVDKKALKKARIAILGYGSQGRAHALNLKDSGHDVVVGVRKSGGSWKKGQERRPQGRRAGRCRQGC
jgi:ketol-acid reductoisomerase